MADNGTGKADVVLDSVAVMDARRVVGRFTELEVELVEGDEQALEAISRALRKAGAGKGERRPKVFRVLGLSDDEPAVPADDAAALGAMLERQHDQILANDRESGWKTIPRRSIACGSQRADSAPSSARQPPCSSASGPSACEESSGGSQTPRARS